MLIKKEQIEQKDDFFARPEKNEKKRDPDAALAFLIDEGQPDHLFRFQVARHDPKIRPMKALRAAAKSQSGHLASLVSYFSYQQEQYHEALALALRHKNPDHILEVAPFLKQSGDRGNVIIEAAQIVLSDKEASLVLRALSDSSLAKGICLSVAFDNQALWEQIKAHNPSLFAGNNLLKILDGLLLQEEILPPEKQKAPKLFKKIWTESSQAHRNEFCEISKNLFRKDQEKHKKIILTFLKNKIDFSEACPESKKFESFMLSQVNKMRKREASFFLENYTPKNRHVKHSKKTTDQPICSETLYGF